MKSTLNDILVLSPNAEPILEGHSAWMSYQLIITPDCKVVKRLYDQTSCGVKINGQISVKWQDLPSTAKRSSLYN